MPESSIEIQIIKIESSPPKKVILLIWHDLQRCCCLSRHNFRDFRRPFFNIFCKKWSICGVRVSGITFRKKVQHMKKLVKKLSFFLDFGGDQNHHFWKIVKIIFFSKICVHVTKWSLFCKKCRKNVPPKSWKLGFATGKHFLQNVTKWQN